MSRRPFPRATPWSLSPLPCLGERGILVARGVGIGDVPTPWPAELLERMHHTDMSAEARVKELGLVLPPAPKPVATYVPCVRVGNLLYVSGHGPLRPDRTLVTGRVGAELNEAHGREAARVVGLAMLATLQAQLGTLDRVVRLIKTLGMVNSAPDFLNHPQVINGFSDLMVEVFGESGKGARSAVGMGPLPGNIAVEVEAIFEIRD